jgi:hypothetical protein
MSTASTLETMMRNEIAKLRQEYKNKSAPFIAVLAYLESMKTRAMALTPDMVEKITRGDKEELNRQFGKFAFTGDMAAKQQAYERELREEKAEEGAMNKLANRAFKFRIHDRVKVSGFDCEAYGENGVVKEMAIVDDKPEYRLTIITGTRAATAPLGWQIWVKEADIRPE